MKNILWTLLALLLVGFSTSAFAAGHANLDDVTWGQEVRWIVTSGDATWHASVSYSEGEFMLHAQFTDLTDPIGDDFYEGWLVQKSPFKFISTWELKKQDWDYINHFESAIDYRSYDFYVLTLEPNDGNPAPADHIFEWTVEIKDGNHMMMKDKMMNHVVIDITGENFSFSQKEITVQKWDKVTINFESTWGFHDWVVDEFDAATQQVSPWEKTSVTFIADASWEFEYYCSVWSHRQAGMVWKLIVQDAPKMMKDTMMKKEDAMMKDKMMKQDSKRMALKTAVSDRVAKINISFRKIDIVLERIEALEQRLPSLNLTETKKSEYSEILSVLKEVLADKKLSMMQK